MERRKESRQSSQGEIYFAANASRSQRPWLRKDAAYEWMEVIEMRDVGVQTDPHDTADAPPAPSTKSETQPPTRENEEPLEEGRQSTDGQEDKAQPIHEQDATSQRPCSQVVVGVPEEQPEASEVQIDTLPTEDSLASGVDSERRLTISEASTTEIIPLTSPEVSSRQLALASLNEISAVDVSHTQQTSTLTASQEATRLELLEREVRQLKMRVANLEVDLCHKDTIIAKQDSLMHRYTYALRSLRCHRRAMTTIAEAEAEIPSPDQKRDLTKGEIREMVEGQRLQIAQLMEQLGKCRTLE